MPRGHYLAEVVKDAIWVLRAEGVSEAEIGRGLGMPKRTVSKYLQRVGGVRPRARRWAGCCLTSAERRRSRVGLPGENRPGRSVVSWVARTPRSLVRSTVAVAVEAIARTWPSGRRGCGRDARERRSLRSAPSCVRL